jgi:hypothetical protein
VAPVIFAASDRFREANFPTALRSAGARGTIWSPAVANVRSGGRKTMSERLDAWS